MVEAGPAVPAETELPPCHVASASGQETVLFESQKSSYRQKMQVFFFEEELNT